jgi:predicted nucleic acid-binding protein
VVLDNGVLVASLRSDRGASRRLILGALDRKFDLLASVPLIVEYEAVLTRPEHLDASGLTSRQVNDVLDALVKVSIPVRLQLLSIFVISPKPAASSGLKWGVHPTFGKRFEDPDL